MRVEIEFVLLAFLVLVAHTALRSRDLVAAAFLLGGFSYLLCLMWSMMGAVDVALTEAAVGAGISSALLLAAVHRTRRWAESEDAGEIADRQRWRQRLGLIVVVGLAVPLFYGTLFLPDYRDPEAPAATHVAEYYIERADDDTKVPNIVTAVLADYRGYDTMFELVVIFSAGTAVALLVRRPHRRRHTARIALESAGDPS